MALMNKYTVWIGSGEGEFVNATHVVIVSDTVSFLKDGQEVKRYDKKEFLKNNPDWKPLENTE